MSVSLEPSETKPDGTSLLYDENEIKVTLPKSGPQDQSGPKKGQPEQLMQHGTCPDHGREWEARMEVTARKLELKKLIKIPPSKVNIGHIA